MRIEIYQEKSGHKPYVAWLYSLKDIRTQARIESRVRRLSLGHWGDHKILGGGIAELRLDFGPGYRVYCSRVRDATVILLAGGDKSSQQRDIEKARRYLADHTERT